MVEGREMSGITELEGVFADSDEFEVEWDEEGPELEGVYNSESEFEVVFDV